MRVLARSGEKVPEKFQDRFLDPHSLPSPSNSGCCDAARIHRLSHFRRETKGGTLNVRRRLLERRRFSGWDGVPCTPSSGSWSWKAVSDHGRAAEPQSGPQALISPRYRLVKTAAGSPLLLRSAMESHRICECLPSEHNTDQRRGEVRRLGMCWRRGSSLSEDSR